MQTGGRESEMCFFSKLSGLKFQCRDLEGEVLGCFCRSIPGPRASSASLPEHAGGAASVQTHRECSVTLWAALRSSGSVCLSTVVSCSCPCSIRRPGGVAGLGSPHRAVTATVPVQVMLPSYYFSKLKPEKGIPF